MPQPLPRPLGYDAKHSRIFINDGDVSPTVAWVDDNADPETNGAHALEIVESVNRYPGLLAFVEQMASMMTLEDEFAADTTEGQGLRKMYADADEYRADLDDDRLMDEFATLAHVIREARKLLQNPSETD